MPRSITQTRLALPYWASILRSMSRNVVHVGGVAGQHLVGERKAFGRHDQRDHHLHAIAVLVANVAVAALVRFIVRRRGLIIGAGEVLRAAPRSWPRTSRASAPQMREQKKKRAKLSRK